MAATASPTSETGDSGGTRLRFCEGIARLTAIVMWDAQSPTEFDRRGNMSLRRFRLLAGMLGLALGACGGVVAETPAQGGSGGSAAGSNRSTGGTALSVAAGATSTISTVTSAPSGGNGGTEVAPIATGGAASVVACPGIPTAEPDANSTASACNGVSIEVEPIPLDMIILMDRSISNSFPVGSSDAVPAAGGQTRRWDMLISSMESLSAVEQAGWIGASLTLFGRTGDGSDAANCNPSDYEQPTVGLGFLQENGRRFATAMQSATPAGLSPTVPALLGAYQYAMTEKMNDPAREKVVVLISDGTPTQCKLQTPTDVANVIKDAASAYDPIRTFIVGVGSPITLDAAKTNLQMYARAGNTGKPAFLLDDWTDTNKISAQLSESLLSIANSKLGCEYEISPPTYDWVVNPDEVTLMYAPNSGAIQEIERLDGPNRCAKSPTGGWYFDDLLNPKKISVCPCSCANFGAGKVSLVFGCHPVIDWD